MNTRKSSKDTGNSKTVDGDIVQFGLGTEDNLEQMADITENANIEEIKSEKKELKRIPQLDIKRLYSAYNSVDEVRPFIGYDNRTKEMDVNQLKQALEKFWQTKETYIQTWNAIKKTYENLENINKSLEKLVNTNTNNSQNVTMPRPTHRYILSELAPTIQDINDALSGYEPSEMASPKTVENIEIFDELIREFTTNRNLTEIAVTTEFSIKQCSKILKEIVLYCHGDSSGSDYNIIYSTKVWGETIKKIPDYAISIGWSIDTYRGLQIPIQIFDKDPNLMPAPVVPPKKKSLYESIKDRIKGK